jgi:hypothetical protein
VQARFDHVLSLNTVAPIVCLSGGTVHRPSPLDASGRPIFEAVAGARYLLSKGVFPQRVYTEISSYDTIGNALFARLIHAGPRRWRRLLVVNSEFHMPRTVEIFRTVFGLLPDEGYQLEFQSTANVGIPARALEARLSRELTSLEAFRRLSCTTLEDLHAWLYSEHKAYTPSAELPESTAELRDAY